MWGLENTTPYAAARSWVRDLEGREVWIVAVRATFDLLTDGSLELAKVQSPVALSPQYNGDPGSSSLRCESDIVLLKRSTDVAVHGAAYSPHGVTATEVSVEIRVGPIQRALTVYGDRRWERTGYGELRSTPPEPFSTMSVTYERAFGGVAPPVDPLVSSVFERRNPIGVGLATSELSAEGLALPNIEDPCDPIASWKSCPGPAAFGPIARDWAPRVEYAGRLDSAWAESRQPLLPLDFDERFFQCAPVEQQVAGFLRGGESVELINLSAEGRVRFTLPRASLVFRTILSSMDVTHYGDLHTVMIEPEEGTVTLTWHSSLECHGRDDALRGTVVQEL